MINITNKRAKQLYLAEMTRMMTRLENIQARQLKPVLNKQYLNAASLVRQGVLLEAIDYVVDNERKRLFLIFAKHYRRVATTFSNKTYKVIEDSKKFIIVPDIKGPKDEFWAELNRWTRKETASKVTGIQKTSRKLLAKTIQKGMNEGLSNHDIAKNLVKNGRISTPIRAKTIAITETHTAAVKSVDAAIRSTRIEMEKEWVPNIDKRTRPDHVVMVNHPRVPEGGKFRVGSSSMEYPGDPAGGAAQTIRCRCVLMYHTVKRMDKLKPYVPKPGFVPASSVKEAEERLNKVGVGQIVSSDIKGWKNKKAFLSKAMNPMLEEMERLNTEFPFLISQLNKQKIWSIEVARGKWLPGQIGVPGKYLRPNRAIELAMTDVSHKAKLSLSIGRGCFTTGKSFHSNLRHEIGHHYYDVVSYSNELREKRKEFSKIWNRLGGKNYFKKNISEYAGTNLNESFAEAFSAYTSPLHKGKKVLPKELTNYFDDLLGK